jgi:hypothetical protein
MLDINKRLLAEKNGFSVQYIWYNDGVELGAVKSLETIKQLNNGQYA